MTPMPHKPILIEDGFYHPRQLLRYLDESVAARIPNYRIAQHLRVSEHRITWFLGAGREHLVRRAKRYALKAAA